MKLKLLAAVTAAALLTACSGDSEKDHFVRACQSNGGDQAACSCLYERLTQAYDVQQMEALIEQGDPGFALYMIEAAAACTQ